MAPIFPYIQTPDQVQTLLNNNSITPDVAEMIRQVLPPENLTQSVMAAESNFDPAAVSPKGAQGLMQVMPKTAQEQQLKYGLQGLDPSDPAINQILGATYLGEQLKSSNGDIPLALAKYNAGPGRVKEYGGVPPFPETKDYIQKVQNGMSQYGAPSGGSSEVASPNMPDVPEESAQDKIQAGLEMQKQAALSQVSTQEQAEKERNAANERRQQRINDIYQEELAQQDLEQEQYKKAQENYQVMLDDYRGSTVDRNRLWNSMSTPNKIMAGLGIVLGAIGTALGKPGQDNQALNIMLKAIDQDTNDQVQEITKKGNVLARQAGVLDDLRGKFTSDSAKRSILNSLKLEAVKQDIQSISDNLQSAEQKAKAQELVGKFTELQGAEAQKAAQIEAKRGQVNINTVKSAIDGDEQALVSLPNVIQAKIVPNLGLAKDASVAKDVIEAKTGFDDAELILKRLIQIRGKKSPTNIGGLGKGAEFVDRSLVGEAKQLAASLQAALGKIDRLGPLSGKDYEFLAVRVPEDPLESNVSTYTLGMTSDATLDRLESLRVKMAGSFKNVLNSSLSVKSEQAKELINYLDDRVSTAYGTKPKQQQKQAAVTGMTPR